jgi:hypothetical protein
MTISRYAHPVRWILVFCIGVSACRMMDSGLDAGTSRHDAIPDRPDSLSEGLSDTLSDTLSEGLFIGPDGLVNIDVPLETSGEVGNPLILGCADGTREGFLRWDIWPRVAACSGGFSEKGVVGTEAQTPKCNRMAGNSWAGNPNGVGCGAADLCAVGWHLCLNGQDLALHSPTGDCEGCVAQGDTRFFLVGTGASPQGVCYDDPASTNDLHGCGGRGQAENAGCYPLFRRMAFTDCIASGSWRCGTDNDYLNEANVVSKAGPDHGGVLCCKD